MEHYYERKVSEKFINLIKKLSGAKVIIPVKGMVYMVRVYSEKEMPINDRIDPVKNRGRSKNPLISYKDMGWKKRIAWRRFTRYKCGPYNTLHNAYEIRVPDTDKYIAIVYCKKGSTKTFKVLVDFGFKAIEVE